MLSKPLEEIFPDVPDDLDLSQLDLERIPQHVAVIMDGNGRWAKKRGSIRLAGHKAGIGAVREAIRTASDIGVRYLTLYSFSTENWRRPQHEVNLLMHLFATTLVKELPLFAQENVRLLFLGDIDALPKVTRDVFEKGLEETRGNTGMVFALAVNYGSRAEIARAARALARDVAAGRVDADEVDEASVAARLYTAGLPDPELLIRTSGENRLSNFLLWQIAYTEFYVTDTLWPDFTRWDYLRAVRDFQGRKRRFGGVVNK